MHQTTRQRGEPKIMWTHTTIVHDDYLTRIGHQIIHHFDEIYAKFVLIESLIFNSAGAKLITNILCNYMNYTILNLHFDPFNTNKRNCLFKNWINIDMHKEYLHALGSLIPTTEFTHQIPQTDCKNK